MRKIFVLKGSANCNKTTIINTVAQWILDPQYSAANTIGLTPANLGSDTNGILTVGNLKILVNSAGDSESDVKKIDLLLEKSDVIDVDIIICACRTRGKGRKHILNNYNYSTGWLQKFINIEKLAAHDLTGQAARNTRKIEELKTWLICLPKI